MLTNLLQVYVSVDNVNDNAPLTVQPVYFGRVAENSAANTTVLQVAARDADVGQLYSFSYSITAGNADGSFAIDPQTGNAHLIMCTTSVPKKLWCEHVANLR